eukprot:scaffold78012_cov29-Tisochrysis_lutea.AAC.2
MHLDLNRGWSGSHSPIRGWEKAGWIHSVAALDTDVISREDSSVSPQRSRDSFLRACAMTQLGTRGFFEEEKREGSIAAPLPKPQNTQSALVVQEHEVCLGQFRRDIDLEDNTSSAPALRLESRPASKSYQACSYLSNPTGTRPMPLPTGERNGTFANPSRGDDRKMRFPAMFTTNDETKMRCKRKAVHAFSHGDNGGVILERRSHSDLGGSTNEPADKVACASRLGYPAFGSKSAANAIYPPLSARSTSPPMHGPSTSSADSPHSMVPELALPLAQAPAFPSGGNVEGVTEVKKMLGGIGGTLEQRVFDVWQKPSNDNARERKAREVWHRLLESLPSKKCRKAWLPDPDLFFNAVDHGILRETKIQLAQEFAICSVERRRGGGRQMCETFVSTLRHVANSYLMHVPAVSKPTHVQQALRPPAVDDKIDLGSAHVSATFKTMEHTAQGSVSWSTSPKEQGSVCGTLPSLEFEWDELENELFNAIVATP